MPQANTDMPGQILRNGLPLVSRLLSVDSNTINEAERTVELVWSTGAAVRRFDYNNWRYYSESLSMLPEHCKLGRLNNGAPMLNTHQQWDLEDQIGVVERAWLDNGEGRALLRFSKRAGVEDIWQDVVDKIIRNVSVGYIVHTYQITERDGHTPEYLAVDWEPTEISLVPVPADAGAGIRSATRPDDAPTYPINYLRATEPAAAVEPETPDAAARAANVEPETRQEPTMTPEEIAAMKAAERAAAVAEEQQRQQGIRKLTEHYTWLPPEFARSLLDDTAVTLDIARARLLDKLAENSDKMQERGHHSMETVQDETDVRRERMTKAVMVRAGAMTAAAAGADVREYRGMSLVDMAAECVEAAGGRTRGLSRFEIASAALGMPDQMRAAGMHGTSDFPILLSGAINRTLRDTYANVTQTWLPLSRQTIAPDFREMKEVSMGDFPDLLPLGEGGEYKSGTIKEYANGWKLGTFARKIAITRQAIVNDDLGIFGRLPRMIALAAARTQNNLAWDVIIKNQRVSLDGKQLWHADHGNYGTDVAALGVDSVSVARKTLRKMKSNDGTPLELAPRFLIVGSELETEAERLLASVTPRNADDVNPFSGRLTPIIEPRLDDLNGGKDWFVAVDPAVSPVDILVHAFLEGQEGLYTETKQHTDVDGIELLARMDFGVCAGDYRGIYRQEGA